MLVESELLEAGGWWGAAEAEAESVIPGFEDPGLLVVVLSAAFFPLATPSPSPSLLLLLTSTSGYPTTTQHPNLCAVFRAHSVVIPFAVGSKNGFIASRSGKLYPITYHQPCYSSHQLPFSPNRTHPSSQAARHFSYPKAPFLARPIDQFPFPPHFPHLEVHPHALYSQPDLRAWG